MNCWLEKILDILTPANQRGHEDELAGDCLEDQDKLVEHQHCLCSHPENRGQGEVMQQRGHQQARDVHGSLLNSSSKHKQHGEDWHWQLHVIFWCLDAAQLPTCNKQWCTCSRMNLSSALKYSIEKKMKRGKQKQKHWEFHSSELVQLQIVI